MIAHATTILDIGVDTKDNDAGRFACCVLARKLAVDGKDKKVAWAASVAIAEYFKPDGNGPTNAKEQFKKAQELWDDGDKAEAVEWYAYAKVGVRGVERMLCEKRIKEGGAEASAATTDFQGPNGKWHVKPDCIRIEWGNGCRDTLHRPLSSRGIGGDSQMHGVDGLMAKNLRIILCERIHSRIWSTSAKKRRFAPIAKAFDKR